MKVFETATAALVLFCCSACFGADAAVASSGLRAETTTVPGGAEVITYFQQVRTSAESSEFPLIAVLKDTLGDSDPSNDRLRQIWVFSYRRPGLLRRTAGAIPFLYARSPLPEGTPSKAASPILDMGAPSQGMWKGVAGAIVQSEVLDPIGTTARLISRSYQGNVGNHRRSLRMQALHVLEAAQTGGAEHTLSEQDLHLIEGRMELSSQRFGGLVSDEYLEQAWQKYRTRRLQNRASNWDLLRQRAEENGLYFQPLSLAGLPAAWAMLWVGSEQNGTRQPFDSKFLGIKDPFRDAWVNYWSGYSEWWWVDDLGSRVEPSTPGARQIRVIPLALYSLDHPRAPLLVADMRSSGRPRRTEVARRLVGDVASGVLGLTGFGNWGYAAARAGYSFVRSRHGSPLDRSARLRAYVQVRHALGADESLTPTLRYELIRRVDGLGGNPIDSDWEREIHTARAQYEAFSRYVKMGGLADVIAQNRSDESPPGAARLR